MPLIKPSLSSDLERALEEEPSLEEAALKWAQAYSAYAQKAMSSASSLPTNASGNVGMLQSAFSGALRAQTASGAAAAMGSGVMSFWSAIVWVGAAASGSTLVPGNFSLVGALTQVFSDTEQKSAAEKAGALADAFDAGAKQVVVMDIPFVQPAPPIIGRIS